MPRFPDATGYLLELRDSINEIWFNAVCDITFQSNGPEYSESQLKDLWNYLHGKHTYSPVATPVRPIIEVTATGQAGVFLEELSDFDGFKKLSPGLRLELNKQLTLIFGMNGSGKSSVCEALKVLANPEKPIEPLQNARGTGSNPPSFSYRFKGNTTKTKWMETTGFGTRAQSIKYFDSTIAVRNVEKSLKPEASVEISIFRLEIFEYVGALVSQFQNYLSRWESNATRELCDKMKKIILELESDVEVNAEPFASWSPDNTDNLNYHIKNLPVFDSTKEKELSSLSSKLNQHQTAASSEGLQALKTQLALLNQFRKELTVLINACEAIDLVSLQDSEKLLLQKQTTAIELSKDAFPKGVVVSIQQTLISTASKQTDFSTATSGITKCPLCQQALGLGAQKLFRTYHTYLNSNLQKEIASLKVILNEGAKNLSIIHNFTLTDFSVFRKYFPKGFLDTLRQIITAVKDSVSPKDGTLAPGNPTAFEVAKKLPSYLHAVGEVQRNLKDTIKTATENSHVLQENTIALKEQINKLRAHKAVCARRKDLLKVCETAKSFTKYNSTIRNIDFPTLLRKITLKGKEAHGDLVLGTFEEQLNKEYKSLCGSTLAQVGVRLASRGNQQDVIVTPQIGNEPVHRVLSEGEQKVHALSIFMCEANISKHQILVFDDPVTSFDYNYISNFCVRLRDFMRTKPSTQIIVLTHNWYFFANLQSTLNKSRFDGKLSVQVIENCSTVKEYKEKWEDLCQEIKNVVYSTTEPNDSQKEQLSMLMRRLIERFLNKYVFNEQRHQYKNKSLKIAQFHNFTKIVPLTSQEADDLVDLYAELSPPGHDDLRNYFSSKSLAQFKQWYEKIIALKDGVESRKS